jgi:hypothetical protein
MSNIYNTCIIPLLSRCGSGDELIFISPATMFGVYTLGLSNFERVCREIEKAKSRGCSIKLIINIYNDLTAIAAVGLESILSRSELKARHNRGAHYFIARIEKGGECKECYEIYSNPPKTIKYIEKFEVIPFLRSEQLHGDTAKHKITSFRELWNESLTIDGLIAEYHPDYRVGIKYRRSSAFVAFLVFILGVFLGGLYVGDTSDIEKLRFKFLDFFIALAIGVVGGIFSNYIYRRYWNNKTGRKS